MELSTDQKLAFDQVINQPDHIMINGHAGTGKTYIAIKAIEQLIKNKNVLVLCPTHQAKDQFYLKLNHLVLSPNLELTTVASFLAQYPRIMPDGNIIFSKGSYASTNYDYIFVDECSMVSEYEMKQLMQHKTGKVIFLGDYAQLTPVMKKQGSLRNSIKNINLKTQYRNKNKILNVCEKLRDKLFYPQETDGNIKVYSTWEEMSELFLNKISSTDKPYEYSWLSYHNEEVDYFKQVVHEKLYGNEIFVKDQYIRLDDYCSIGNNGSIVKVLNSVFKPYTLVSGITYNTYEVTLKNERTNEIGSFLMLSFDEQNLIFNLEDRLIEDCKEAIKLKYNDTVKYIHEQLKELRTNFVFYSSPFVQTIHKSQGRSIPYVYVDTLSISEGREKQRLMYVACSRAIDELNLIKV